MVTLSSNILKLFSKILLLLMGKCVHLFIHLFNTNSNNNIRIGPLFHLKTLFLDLGNGSDVHRKHFLLLAVLPYHDLKPAG